MHGVQRVITFCLLTAVLPIIILVIPLYLRHNVFADVTYAVAESDVLEISDGISSLFCQEHSLHMNSSFHAFQVSGSPMLSNNRKHIRLQKKMLLPDDTLEYWGFYLLKGSTVILSVCSRYEGSRILVVAGERNLRTCGLMQHSEKALTPQMADGRGHVKVTFDTNAEVIHSEHVDAVHSAEYEGEENEDKLKQYEAFSQAFIDKHKLKQNNASDVEPRVVTQSRKLRHARHSNHPKQLDDLAESDRKKRRKKLEDSLRGASSSTEDTGQQGKEKKEGQRGKEVKEGRRGKEVKEGRRGKRYVQMKEGHILDAKVGHGHAGNDTEAGKTDESSVSSFENSLLSCYDGQILLVQAFPPSDTCSSEQVLNSSHVMKTTHEVESDGYYYYIFYSDNDLVENDINAVFNIFKPTYQYANYSNGCINQTECTFNVPFWSDETVIVEVPTRDGIEQEEEDITFLISSCRPRMSVYVIFPITVLFLILGCAFL